MPNASRNDPLGFAKRTLKNLDYVGYATDPESSDPNVHLVTQILNSMLGLVVFPHAAYLHPSSQRLLKNLRLGWAVTSHSSAASRLQLPPLQRRSCRSG